VGNSQDFSGKLFVDSIFFLPYNDHYRQSELLFLANILRLWIWSSRVRDPSSTRFKKLSNSLRCIELDAITTVKNAFSISIHGKIFPQEGVYGAGFLSVPKIVYHKVYCSFYYINFSVNAPSKHQVTYTAILFRILKFSLKNPNYLLFNR
jgi:hypothetical protein